MNNEVSVEYKVHAVTKLTGEIRVPGDKSVSHRALMLGAIAQGQTTVHGFLNGADNLATLNVMRALGVNIALSDDQSVVQIEGVGLHGLTAPTQDLDCGNAGTGMRLLAGLLSAQSFDSVLVGDESLTKRPMGRVVNPLRMMGAMIDMSDKGTPPLRIGGGQVLTGIEYSMPVASAQVKSCLLLAGLYAEDETTVIEPGPARDHTERMLLAFGYPVNVEGQRITIRSGGKLTGTNIEVPADISSAAFFMVAASITPGSQIILKSVGLNPTRVGVLNILRMMGADIRLHNESKMGAEPVADIEIRYAQLKGIEIPQDQVPLAIDEFPVIFIAAACAEGETVLRGAKELRVKETDRIAAMAEGLQTLGISVQTFEDGMLIQGGKLGGGRVKSHDDHRIAMAFAVAGCVAADEIIVENCNNVQTSFPNFADLANQIGCCIE